MTIGMQTSQGIRLRLSFGDKLKLGLGLGWRYGRVAGERARARSWGEMQERAGLLNADTEQYV